MNLIAQTTQISDFIINSDETEENPVSVYIPRSIVDNAIPSDLNRENVFKHVEVKLRLLDYNGDVYFWDGGFEGATVVYYETIYKNSGDYDTNVDIHHSPPIDGGYGYYPTKLGVRIDYVIVYYQDPDFPAGQLTSVLVYAYGDGDESEYLYWNKNSSVNEGAVVYGAIEGANISATANYSGGDYPMTYYWNVYVKDSNNDILHTLFENHSTGSSNELTNIQIPNETNGNKLSFYYRVVLDRNTDHYVEHNSEVIIKPWYEGMSFDLSSSNMQICYGEQSTFNLNYSDNEIPDHVGYTWQVSNNLQVISSTKTSLTVKAISTGKGIANVTLNLDGVPEIQSDDMWVGKPSFTLTPLGYDLTPYEIGIMMINYSSPSANQGVYDVNWTRSGAIASVNGSLTKGTFRAGRTGGVGDVYADAFNSCGSYEARLMVYVQDDFFMYGPNPVDDNLTITSLQSSEPYQSKEQIDEPELMSSIESESSSYSDQFSIVLYNENKEIVYTGKMETNEIIIDTSKLKNGNYYLHVTKNNVTERKQIVVEHN